MKKLVTLTLLAVVLLCACEKEGNQTATQKQMLNRVITLPDSGKTGNSTVLLSICIGHDGRNCNGCVFENGQLRHMDCMGEGNYCATATFVHLQQVGTAVTATTTDTFGLTSEDFFLMPSRSLDYEDEKGNHLFLNIPSQMVYRDNTTLQFTFTGLFFSNTAAYSND